MDGCAIEARRTERKLVQDTQTCTSARQNARAETFRHSRWLPATLKRSNTHRWIWMFALYKWIMTYNVRIIRWKTLIVMRFTYPHLTILCKLILFYVRVCVCVYARMRPWAWVWVQVCRTLTLVKAASRATFSQIQTLELMVMLLLLLPLVLFSLLARLLVSHCNAYAYLNWQNMGLVLCWHRYCHSTLYDTLHIFSVRLKRVSELLVLSTIQYFTENLDGTI